MSCTLIYLPTGRSRHKTILYSVETPDDKEVSRGSTSWQFSALIKGNSKTNEWIDRADLTQHSKRKQQSVVLKLENKIRVPVETEFFAPISIAGVGDPVDIVFGAVVAWELVGSSRTSKING